MSSAFVPASEISPEPIEWLWPGRLALGKIALLEGDPELGKSWVTCDLCARLSVGQLFPDGQPSPGPANSILLNDEDGSADTLRPRLEALGADLKRVIIPNPRDEDTPLTLPSQWRRLEALIKSHDARLVVIDPWIAFLDTGLESASDSTIRKVLRTLTRMAQRCRCTLLLLRHLRKAGGRRAVYRGVGSIGLVAACRSAWLIARSPLDDICVFAQLKNNLAARQPSLAYEFRSQAAVGSGSGQQSEVGGQRSEVGNQKSEVGNQKSEVGNQKSEVGDQKSEVGDQKSEVGARGTIEDQKSTIENHMPFRWLGPTFWSADELTGGRLTRAGRRAQARAFLQECLRTEAQPIGKVKTAAKDQGIAERTLSRAGKELKLQLRRVIFPGCHPRNYWLLPGQKLPAVIPDEYVAPAW